jgi:hypothetical protein
MVWISDLLHLLSHARNASGNLGVPIKTKLHFHQQVDTIFSPAVGVNSVCDFRLFFIARSSNATLHFNQLEYAYVAWNSINSDSRNLECIQRKFYLLIVIFFPVTDIKSMIML